MKLLTLKEFNKLYNDHFNERMGEVGSKSKVFKTTKRKVIRDAVVETRFTESGVPYLHTIHPKVTKEVIDTNGLTALYIAAAKLLYGIELHRVSSEGRGRWDKKQNRMIYLKSPNKGMADLQGIYKGISINIEVKRPGEPQLPSQKEYESYVKRNGGVYEIVRSWEEFQVKMNDLVNRI